MVLDICVEGCDASMSCRYSGFSKFRCEILRGWNEELGRLYEEKLGFLWDDNNTFSMFGLANMLVNPEKAKEHDRKIAKILDEYDKPYNEGIKLFYHHSDCDGEFNPKECELVLKAFNHVDPEKFDKKDEETNKWLRESYETWITMLKYAIENNKSIIFG